MSEKLKLGSKAKTLEDLEKIINEAKVLPLFRFFAVDYINQKDLIIDKIKNLFETSIIVRSSSSNEDNIDNSNAGGFDSVLDVDIKSIKEIVE